jgi:hypothetical protein
VVAAAEPSVTEGAEPALPDPYEIVSIRSVPAPSGTAGANWYRYEISQGHNTITGYRDGGIDSVRLAVEAIVIRLNERRRQRRGRVHVVLQQSRSGVTKSGN